MRIEADSAEAREELAAALETWAGHLPSASVTTPEPATRVEVTSCDPGDHKSEESANRVDEALVAPALRLVVMRDLLAEGIADVGESWCVADGVIDELTAEELAADEPTPRIQGLVVQVMVRCGVQF